MPEHLRYDRGNEILQPSRTIKPMTNDFQLIDSQEISRMDDILAKHENAMEIGALDGFLTAVALAASTADMTEEDLLPYVFSEEGDPAAVPDEPELFKLIEERRRMIKAAFQAGNGLDPVVLYDLDDDGNTIEPKTLKAVREQLEPWASGFLVGASLWQENEYDEAFEGMMPIFNLAPSIIDQMHEEDPDTFNLESYHQDDDKPYSLQEGLYDLVEAAFNLRKELAPNQPIRREEKRVGRNDPCPCGSGKKYKQCCGKRS